MRYHEGDEKLVTLDADHELNSDLGPELFDEAVYWSAAWFLTTLR